VAAVVRVLVFPHLLRHVPLEISLESAAPAAGSGRADSVRVAAILGIIAFCVMMGEGAMADWSALYLRHVMGTSEGLAAVGYAVFSIAMALGRFWGDRLSVRFGPVSLVRGGGALATAGLLLVLGGPQSLYALLGFAAVGAGFATIVPQVFSAAGRASGGVAGAAVASVTTIGYLGFLLGPPVIGFAAEHVGLCGGLAMLVLTSFLLVPLAGGRRCFAQPGWAWANSAASADCEKGPAAGGVAGGDVTRLGRYFELEGDKETWQIPRRYERERRTTTLSS
jgi:MFS family permease